MQIFKQKLKIDSKYCLTILNYLGGREDKSRLVGGSVRDALLNLPHPDIDIATSLLPENVTSILTKNNIKVIPTGIEHGTVTAILVGEKFEITTLRKDIDCDGRRAVVSFTNSFEEDAARRDFTINALSYNPFTEEIYDYFDGIKDLQARRVVFIGDPKARIREDVLRIMRFFRFSSYYSTSMDVDGLEAAIDLQEMLGSLPKERIKTELDKLLMSPNSPHILDIIKQNGFLDFILVSFQVDNKVYTKLVDSGLPTNLTSRYSALLHENNEQTIAENLPQLRFSRGEIRAIKDKIIFFKKCDRQDIKLLLAKKWLKDPEYEQYIFLAIILSKISLEEGKSLLEFFKDPKPIFPIDGVHLQKLGFSGRDLGVVIKYLEEKWILSDFKLNQVELLKLAKDYNAV